MDFPTVLIRDLLDLSANLDDHDELDGRLTSLVTALRAAVPTYRGLSVTAHGNVHPVTLTSFLPTADGDIATSLRLPLTAVEPGIDTRSRVIFNAATPGAFVDIAADLGHALHLPAIPAHPGRASPNPSTTQNTPTGSTVTASMPTGSMPTGSMPTGSCVITAKTTTETKSSCWTAIFRPTP